MTSHEQMEIVQMGAGAAYVSSVLLSSWLASEKSDRLGAGFIMGLLLGPFGVIAAGLLPPSPQQRYADEVALERDRRKARTYLDKEEASYAERQAATVARYAAEAAAKKSGEQG